MIYITATTKVKNDNNSDEFQQSKIIIFIESGMSVVEFEKDGCGITTKNERIRVKESIDELLSSAKSLEVQNVK